MVAPLTCTVTPPGFWLPLLTFRPVAAVAEPPDPTVKAPVTLISPVLSFAVVGSMTMAVTP